jgi:hypothetical protein
MALNSRAKWVEDVPDLYDLNQLDTAGNYLTLAEVATRLNMSPNTVEDLLTRPRSTAARNPNAPISRPAFRTGNKPLYTEEQVAEVEKRRSTADKRGRFLGGGDEQLPRVTVDEAHERNLATTDEMAELAKLHPQSLRRWARDREDYPKAVALCARPEGSSGVPFVVYARDDVLNWLRTQGHLPSSEVATSASAGTG